MRKVFVFAIVVVLVVIVLFFSLGAGPSLNNTSSNNKSLGDRFALDLSSQIEQNTDDQLVLDVDTIPTYDGYIFLGYAWEATARTPEYTYNANTNTFTPATITLRSDNPNRTLYAVWKSTIIRDIADATYLQDMNADVCNSMTLDKQYTLTDKRDNKTYTVAKLKMTPDGTRSTCWMTQDLALNLSTSQTFTREDTDLNSVDSFTPERNTTTTLSTATFPVDVNHPYSYNSASYGWGYFYNWTAAIASNDSSALTAQYSEAPDSICPKGWRLPRTNGASVASRPNEFGNLLYSYGIIPYNDATYYASGGSTKIEQNPLNFLKSKGFINLGAHRNYGVDGGYWGSYVNSPQAAYNFGFYSNAPYPLSNQTRSYGFFVRCILR